MAKDDMWCEFCDQKPKNTIVKVRGKEFAVCSHCESLTVQDRKKEATD